jgi:hypothetical protein
LHLPVTGLPSRPLETIRALLDQGGLAVSSGFRRKDARLDLVVVTAEDDPTAATEAQRNDFANFVWNLVPDPDWEPSMLAVIAPAGAQGLASLADLMNQSRNRNGAFDDLAADSWSGPEWIAESNVTRERQAACEDRAMADADPSQPGVHPDCYVEEFDFSHALQVEHTIPFCQGNGTDPDPCWRTRLNYDRCPASGIEFQIVRAFACMPSYSINYAFTCATRPQ